MARGLNIYDAKSMGTMTRSTIAAAIFASLILLILTGHAFSADVSSLVGDWQGTLDPEGNSLRLVIHITSDSAGKLKVSLDCIDQGSCGLPGTDLVLDGRNISYLVPSVNGSYHGTISVPEHETQYQTDSERSAGRRA